MTIKFETIWPEVMGKKFSKLYFSKLIESVNQAYEINTVYPAQENIFQAFTHCPLNHVKVVILGQDPYHGPNQANGLAFSVPEGVSLPPSLKNIYREINADTNTIIPSSGDLTRWAKQGVLLLNSVLTVKAGQANSHQAFGWEKFTDSVLEIISTNYSGVVFMLWGKQAQAKEKILDSNKHLILKTSHPSPLSVYRGFFGCKHFSKCNQYLISNNRTPIKW